MKTEAKIEHHFILNGIRTSQVKIFGQNHRILSEEVKNWLKNGENFIIFDKQPENWSINWVCILSIIFRPNYRPFFGGENMLLLFWHEIFLPGMYLAILDLFVFLLFAYMYIKNKFIYIFIRINKFICIYIFSSDISPNCTITL